MKPASRDDRSGQLTAAIFLFGLAISCWMVVRSQVAGDQLNLLSRGWLLVVEGHWVPFGPPATGGGAQPGGLTSLLVGLPLLLWRDHRAPVILMLAAQAAAYLLLDRLLRPILGPRARVLFALLYWLNPWRLFLSGFLWNPNFLFLPAALHLGTAYALRSRPRFWPSCVHVLVLAASMQIHAAGLLLVISSALLWWRRYVRLDLRGAGLGALASALALLPWASAVLSDPGLLPIGSGFIGRGFALVYPVLQGALHWLRFPGLALGQSMVCLDFLELGGPGLERIGPLLGLFRILFLPATLLLAGWANWQLWRSAGRHWRACHDPAAGDRAWIEGVIRWSFLAALVTFGLAPVSIVYWYVVALFHLAVLPVVLAADRLLDGPRRRWALRGAWCYAAIMLLLAPALALGAPPYRCGEPRCTAMAFRMPPLISDHPMLHELGVHRTCPVVVNDPDGWWVDVLPAQPAPPGQP